MINWKPYATLDVATLPDRTELLLLDAEGEMCIGSWDKTHRVWRIARMEQGWIVLGTRVEYYAAKPEGPA